MPTILLTKSNIDKAERRPKRYELFDTKLPGFAVRMGPKGPQSYILMYRADGGGRSGKRRKLTLGQFSKLTPDEARKLAEKHIAAITFDADPVIAKAKRRATVTVQELADRFLEGHVAGKLKASTAATYTDIINRIVLPELGSAKVDAVTKADLLRLHASWSATPYQANRMLAIVGSMYRVGADIGLVEEGFNPAKGIKARDRYRESRREKFLTTDELERLGAAIRLAETEGVPWVTNEAAPGAKHLPKKPENRRAKLSAHAAAALRLLIFTGARLREILHLRWAEVDLQRGLLLLPDSKTGRKTIVLSGPARAVLESLPRVGDYVIAGDDPKEPRKDLKRPWAAVSKAAGLNGVRLHDLRHTFASYGAAEGLGLIMIGKLLGHADPATTQRYIDLDSDPVRRATDAIGQTIANAMGETKPSAANDDNPEGVQKQSR